MNSNQKKLLLFLPIIVFAKCASAVGTVLREIPAEFKATYKFLEKNQW